MPPRHDWLNDVATGPDSVGVAEQVGEVVPGLVAEHQHRHRRSVATNTTAENTAVAPASRTDEVRAR